LSRIHQDILKVWNFHDPAEVCSIYYSHLDNLTQFFTLAAFRGKILYCHDQAH
jgi:hypothetical protein